MEYVMSTVIKKIHPALKHGAYSAIGLLPGEDRAAFNKLYQGLIAQYNPVGPLEEQCVDDITRYLWRKQNLETFRVAQEARNLLLRLQSRYRPSPFFPVFGLVDSDPEKIAKA